MIQLAWPWMALLAPLPWLLYRFRSTAEPGGSVLFLPMTAHVRTAPTRSTITSRGALSLFSLLWLLLVLASMRPQWLGDPVAVQTTGRRLLLATDVSGSMATEDMADGESRLQVVQQVAGRFIDHRRGDQVGLILFGTRPYLQSPLSTDLATVHRFLDEAVVGVAGTETAIGDAIGLAIKRLADQGGKRGETVLILLTDGVNDAGMMPPLQAARLAAQQGLRIYTIGVGAANDVGITGIGGLETDLDEETLKAIAKATGGRYFRAQDASALQAIYDRIDQLEPAAAPSEWLRPTTEWFLWPLALALLTSVPSVWVKRRSWA